MSSDAWLSSNAVEKATPSQYRRCIRHRLSHQLQRARMSLLPHQGSLDACLRSCVAGRRTFTKPAAKSLSCPVDLEMKVVHPTSSFTLNPRSYCLTPLGRVCVCVLMECRSSM
jgi:hypothetical protein